MFCNSVLFLFDRCCPAIDITHFKLMFHFCTIVGRGVLTPLFYEDPPIILPTPLFSNIVLKYIRRQPPPPLLFMFSCFSDWMGDHLLTGIMDLYMSSVVTLVPEAPWCVFYATTRHQVYWGLPNNVIFCWYSDLISHTHTNTHSTLRGQ